MDFFAYDSDLGPDTKLYRYISVESFMAFVESGQLGLTRVNCWEDSWEAILSKVPAMNDKGELVSPLYSVHEHMYGQCWSLTRESDALWRIYSPTKTGIQISTSVEKFRLVQGCMRCYLGKVVYFDSVAELAQKASGSNSRWTEALFKRAAFSHECEVRFLTHGDFVKPFESHWTHISLPVDPTAFIESVTIDPRADNWYVGAITNYCARAGLPTPVKSTLYDPEPHLTLGLVKKYVPVEDK